LVITSHMSDMSKAAVVFGQLRSPTWLFALLPAFISLVVPTTAWGDIYKWTDERGGINFSDSPPPTSARVKNVEVVEKEIKPTPTEQALLARIQNLERQLQAPQYAAQAPASQPPMPYGGYSPSMPPPPSDYYDSGYDSSYNPSYAPSYYQSYSYPVVPAYSYAVFPRRTFFARPVFVAPPSGFAHAGGGHGRRR
jgi:hypothetical protein